MICPPINRKEVISLLTQDDYYRRQRKWPLISYNNVNVVASRKVSDDLFSIKTYNRTSILNPMDKIIDQINTLFPFTNELLTKFQNNLVACGGSICKSIITDHNEYQISNDDIDFFFYDLDIYQANKMRIEIIEFMINTWKSSVGKKATRNRGYHRELTVIKDVKFYIQRNEYVTTLHVEELCDYSNNPIVYMYQFIHRIYPNINSIIGGFDLSSSALAYNGKEIYTTPLGAWSLINKSIIIDMGRRSTSYEHRLKKYNRYGFRLIFPGLTKDIIYGRLIYEYEDRSFEKFQIKLEKFANDNNYLITNACNLQCIFHKKKGGHINKYDLLGCHNLQIEKDILPYLILDINYKNIVNIKQSKGCEYDWFNPETYDEKGRCGDKEYYLNKLSDYGNDEEYLAARSDYSHNHMDYKHIPSANATRLRLNNLNGVVSMLYIDDHQNIEEKLINEVNNPNLGINDFVIDLYKTKVTDAISEFNHRIDISIHRPQPKLIKCFGSFTSEIVNNQDHTKYVNLMIENIKENDKICKENLTGIRWITENPGRQWTSSINPIFKNPRDWYGKYYVPVLVGIQPEIETLLRLMKLERTESVWSTLPKDLFDLLLSYIFQFYANEAWQYIRLM